MGFLILKIYPEILIYKKPRLSNLSFIGYKNLTRLPKRSAVIAFSQIDVYEIANKLKQSHGGVSVVLGALSPDVRNAQVKLFEEGKVDYIVATDAIGMGLNLDIKNIFFSGIKKFDGFNDRFLSMDEISQIAGRAGRFCNDGFFGTTCNLKSLSPETVKFVENYEFTKIKKIYWRNDKLNFGSPKALLNSLSDRPKENYLKIKKNGNDHRYLKIFLDDKELKEKILNPTNLEKLWEVCGVPDYSKNLDEYHTRFLKKIFYYLISKKECVPEEWVKNNLHDINKFTKKISELNYKISQLRTWSFISFKSKWMENNHKFQNKVKMMELKFAIRLHEELMLEFIGEYKNFELNNSKNLIQANEVVRLEVKKIFFGNAVVGRVDGLKFNINIDFKKSNNIFNNKILEKNLNKLSNKIKDSFLNSSFDCFDFCIDGSVMWRDYIIGQFSKEKFLLNPKIKIFMDKYFLRFEESIKLKVRQFLKFLLKKELPFINYLNKDDCSSRASRAIDFCVLENLGHCQKKMINNFLRELSSEEHKRYKDFGFKVGKEFFYFKTKKIGLFSQMLINIFYKTNMKNFIYEPIFILNLKKSDQSKILFYKKLGFYTFKANKKNFLIHYQYYESLSSKFYFFKKKQNHKFLPNNKFEKSFFKNPKQIIST